MHTSAFTQFSSHAAGQANTCSNDMDVGHAGGVVIIFNRQQMYLLGEVALASSAC